MATIRSFTDLEQSKKLAEILPIESADMEYMFLKKDSSKVSSVPFIKEDDEPEWPDDSSYDFIPCWSLAAMLDALPSNLQLALAINDYQGDIKERYAIGSVNSDIYDCYADNPIDACYEMIIKLHEQKLL